MARRAKFFFDEAEVAALQVEDLEAAIAAVGDDELGFVAACVDEEAVRAIQLAGIAPRAAECAFVFAFLAEAMHEA